MSPWIPGAWVMLAALGIVLHTSKDGEQMGKYCGVCRFITTAIGAGLLWWGGFFGPLLEALR